VIAADREQNSGPPGEITVAALDSDFGTADKRTTLQRFASPVPEKRTILQRFANPVASFACPVVLNARGTAHFAQTDKEIPVRAGDLFRV
jgi:hypothetical protein